MIEPNDPCPKPNANNEQEAGDNREEHDHGLSFDLEPEAIRRSNALYLLKFIEKACVPQTVVDSFVEAST